MIVAGTLGVVSAKSKVKHGDDLQNTARKQSVPGLCCSCFRRRFQTTNVGRLNSLVSVKIFKEPI